MTEPKIHFLTHHQAITGEKTLQYLHKLHGEHGNFLWLVNQKNAALKLIDWIWQQNNWIVCDTVDRHIGGIALSWSGHHLPRNLPILNFSSQSIDHLPNPFKYELVTQENTQELRQRFLFYKQKKVQLNVTKS